MGYTTWCLQSTFTSIYHLITSSSTFLQHFLGISLVQHSALPNRPIFLCCFHLGSQVLSYNSGISAPCTVLCTVCVCVWGGGIKVCHIEFAVLWVFFIVAFFSPLIQLTSGSLIKAKLSSLGGKSGKKFGTIKVRQRQRPPTLVGYGTCYSRGANTVARV